MADTPAVEYVFDEAAAERAVQFFHRYCVHVKGDLAGQPLLLDDWQQHHIIRPLFGWKQQLPGVPLARCPRRYRRAYIEVPRKNGKSTLAAGVGLYLTYADGEPGAEVYSAAADRGQAAIVFDIARQMVEQSPQLAARGETYRRSVVVGSSFYKVISADSRTKHGFNAHGVIFDEIHTQPNRNLYDVLKTSQGSRRQPLLFGITTAGIYDRTSLAWQLHEHALRVLSGEIEDPTLLAVVYAAPQDADWTDPEVWKACNPSLGTAVRQEYLEAEADTAQEQPSYQNTFRRLHLNQWTEQVERWLPMDDWDACSSTPKPATGRVVWAGLDLSSTTDLTTLIVVGYDEDDDMYDVWCRFWLPRDTMHRRVRTDNVPYDAWARDGYLELTDGNVVDYMAMRLAANELAGDTGLVLLGYDPWNATGLATELKEQDGLPLVQVRQGYVTMNEPSKLLERLVVSHKLRHGGNPVLRWCAGNVAVKTDPAGNIKPDKKHSTERIDGIVGLVVALAASLLEDPEPESVYETGGLFTLGG